MCRMSERSPSWIGSDTLGQEAGMRLYEEPHFTFRFNDDRIIPRFHLEGIQAGRRVSVFKMDPSTGERLVLLATATAGEGGWVDLTDPIIVRASEGFIAVPEPAQER